MPDQKSAGPPYFAAEVCQFPVFRWGGTAPGWAGLEIATTSACGAAPAFRLLCRNPLIPYRVGWNVLCQPHRTLVLAEVKAGYSNLEILKIVEA